MTVRRVKSKLEERLAWRIKRASGIIFDALHGVDTSGGVLAEKLEIASPNTELGIAYDPCPWSTLRCSLQLVSLRAEEYTFVDIGSGKGKVLLSAIALPFKHVVGVEYSSYLSRVAEENIASARLLRRQCPSVELVCGDAINYSIPDDPTIFFFANPFLFEVMQTVLDNIITSYLRTPRSIFLIFYGSSSMMPRISEFLLTKSGKLARQRVSSMLRKRSINIFELIT
jgi:SAM-dependent methyltransferase